jgi:hypothetical protein
MIPQIAPAEKKAAEIAAEISKIIKSRTTRYPYFRPDGKNIDELVQISQKSIYPYSIENAQRFVAVKPEKAGEIFDFRFG